MKKKSRTFLEFSKKITVKNYIFPNTTIVYYNFYYNLDSMEIKREILVKECGWPRETFYFENAKYENAMFAIIE